MFHHHGRSALQVDLAVCLISFLVFHLEGLVWMTLVYCQIFVAFTAQFLLHGEESIVTYIAFETVFGRAQAASWHPIGKILGRIRRNELLGAVINHRNQSAFN